jgi:hypothetical protein
VKLAAGRARARGLPTRGTTAPGRLRRNDRWLVATHGARLRAAADPLVVDLGYGSSPDTAIELAAALSVVRRDVRVVGVENDRARVAAAQSASTELVSFVYGSFDVAGLQPVLIRAMNVLRQYAEPAVAPAWEALTARLAPDGVLVEGTCDEVGRRGCWVTADTAGPRTLTLSAHLASLSMPSDVAPRLPKALIHRNVPGEGIHALLAAADAAWARAAPYASFGPRQRWMHTAAALRTDGWPVRDGPRRWRLGELTVDWSAVVPRAQSPS